ncbi:glucan endo-1,3-beta-glucosidase 7-like [Phoenix dactylifera]|uniref:glucan endo-1,3-beta-D-glucosidase n=1 Tax=Phoenix dactylifera TaxID=42345 RepID=A0A8B9ATB7_PHODC|nr:glucan endo-1,3-beta-glucosidase 7-like [Phoenix dactylifera]
MEKRHQLLVIFLFLAAFFSSGRSQSYIGINYGQMADNLPPVSATAKLLESTTFGKVRLYGADPGIIQALAGTNISLVLGAANADIPSLAADPSAASRWVSANVAPFLPSSSIAAISVGNEALNSSDPSLASNLLPAMQNLHSALSSAGSAAASIKVSTVHSMAVLSQSEPPSSGAFRSDLGPALAAILAFLRDTGSPFMINPYPYFAYRDDPRPETLAFCLFQPNPGRLDAGSKITYTNMFDAQVDAIHSALNAAGFPDVEIVVAETGWPYRGDPGEAGTTVDNAKAFNGNLVAHLRSMAGTPLMPGRPVETYIFALYDEDLKPGPTSERSFGLFRTDLTMIYDAGLSKSSPGPSQAHSTPPPPAGPAAAGQPCVPGTVAQASTGGGPIQCSLPSAVGSNAPHTMDLSYWFRFLVDRRLRSNGFIVSVTYRTLCFSFSFLFYATLSLLLI